MSTFLHLFSVCGIILLATFAGAWAGNDTAPAAPAPAAAPAPTPADKEAETKAMVAIWESMNAPGKNHEMLARFVGTWDAKCSFWLKPTDEPVTGTGTLTSESIYEGRFVRSSFSGTGLSKDKPLMGTSFLGYNTMTKKFETFWIDSSTTGMMLATGDATADGKTLTFTHTFDDPLTGGKTTAKYVYAWTGDDAFVFTMYRTVGEKDVKEGEITYTRRK